MANALIWFVDNMKAGFLLSHSHFIMRNSTVAVCDIVSKIAREIAECLVNILPFHMPPVLASTCLGKFINCLGCPEYIPHIRLHVLGEKSPGASML